MSTLNFTANSPDADAMRAARARWDAVAKPLHGLGRLEDLIVQIAGIQGSPEVALAPRCALIFCADNGVVAEGVSQSGSEVTALVAQSIARGEANVSLMAAAANAQAVAVDMGMAQRVDHPALICRRLAPGTRCIACGPAMTRSQAEQAVKTGWQLVGELRAQGCRLIAVGEMGIGNTTTAAAVLCALLGLDPAQVAGRGAGLDDDGLARKVAVIRRALAINRPDPADALDVLCKVGGFDLAGMAGAFIGGAAHRVPMVIDGAVSGAAALLAARLCPACRDFMLPSHKGREPAAAIVLGALSLSPVLHADMALGEGTGAVALFPLLDMAARVYGGTHTFSSLGMGAYTPQEGSR